MEISLFKKYFIQNYINQIIIKDNIPKIIYEFTEEDYKKEIEPILEKEHYKETTTYNKFLEEINKESNIPRIKIKNFNIFIQLLYTLYNKIKEIDPLCPEENIIGYILLRTTINDINDIEIFLKHQIEMIDTIKAFKGLEQEYNIGNINFLGNNPVTVQIQPTDTFNENSYEMKITVGSTILPLVRFGVYLNGTYPICSIGSIQNTLREEKNKQLERAKYKLNEGIKETNTEPKKIISLLIFLNIMEEYGLTTFEMHGHNIYDYKFHQNLSNYAYEQYTNALEKKDEFLIGIFSREKDKYYNKEDIVSKMKTENLFNLVNRINEYYSNLEVLGYPYEITPDYRYTIPTMEIKTNNKAVNEIHEKVHEAFKRLELTETPKHL